MNYYKERAIQIAEDLRDIEDALNDELDALEYTQKSINELTKRKEALEKELAEIVDPKV